MSEASYQNMIDALKTAGYRMTAQRRAICRVLAESKEHPSIQMIFDRLREEDDTLSLATVYNTLDALTRLGVVNTLGEIGDKDSVRYDADTSPHVNLACVECHQIVDISSAHIHSLVKEISQNSGYTLLGARVLYYGVCPDCQAKKETTTNHGI